MCSARRPTIKAIGTAARKDIAEPMARRPSLSARQGAREVARRPERYRRWGSTSRRVALPIRAMGAAVFESVLSDFNELRHISSQGRWRMQLDSRGVALALSRFRRRTSVDKRP